MASYLMTGWCDVIDVDAQTARVSYRSLQADTVTLAQKATEVATFGTDVAAASNGKVIRQGFTVLTLEAHVIPGTPPPTDAVFPSVTDGARIVIANGSGAKGGLTVPAPRETAFVAGQTYVDPAGAASALITFLTGHATDIGGTLLNLYISGTKVGRGARRRVSNKARV
jgi:hypothetical protein